MSHGRVEDARLLTGRGRFVADAPLPGQLHAVFLRAPHAHARLVRLDTEAARRAPGVRAVLTAAEMRAFGAGNVSQPLPLAGREGRPLVVPHRPALAEERVLHVGQPVALVVAESLPAALDAAELIEAEYEALPAVTDARAALAPGAPLLWPEAPGNLALDWAAGDPEQAVAPLLLDAAHVVRLSLVQQRLAGVPLEPRGATAEWHPMSDRFTLHAPSQGAAMLRDGLAAASGLPPERLRVLTGDVGGAFGLKTPAYPEYVALLAAARLTGRPVHWMATRSEAFLSDNQARDGWEEAALGLDAEGRFVALRVIAVVNLGAFVSSHGALIATANFARCIGSLYRIPRISAGVRLAFTNTVPTGPYRGAGRPEANYLMERLVEAAARELRLDPLALRRRNMIAPEAMPYRTPVGATYDSGDFAAVLDGALLAADAAAFPARRAEAVARGRRRGLGVSCFLEHSGAIPFESSALAVEPETERCVLRLGVQSTGQGHETVFARLVAERLGIDPSQVVLRQGDSDFGLRGAASVASRSTALAGSAALRGTEAVIATGRALAATLLESAEADIAFRDGAFEVAGTDRRIGLFAVAREAARRGDTLDAVATAEVPDSFPNGCHVAEVELDPETGQVEVVGYTAVDDCGTVLDHALADAQVMGGAAQGIGQALMERVVHDPASGQPLSGSLMDYALPRAADLPAFRCAMHPVPCRTNPLGAKGVGEAGTTAAIAAVMNAIADALPDGRGAALQMPATAEAIWRACRG
ncbi:xanthine dehydrogenase family protein molybdopterin-binding subunit [Falsiroseomonas oryzae]|uniref:xanthine dehydrogenase family protein molybdopterin-binding subunit n=1 Tax=Falsiroseomonas oryzae TaxID=2766473 RepID=UPI0022EB6B0A|nr:xanthine dehydrogenase family protein molybdopterin-binding subunit [Roseomonas sp. MO-31]